MSLTRTDIRPAESPLRGYFIQKRSISANNAPKDEFVTLGGKLGLGVICADFWKYACFLWTAFRRAMMSFVNCKRFVRCLANV